MLSKNLKNIRFAGILLTAILMCSFIVYPQLKSDLASLDIKDAEKQMELLKAEMEQSNNSPLLTKRYDILAGILSSCNTSLEQIFNASFDDPLAPANNFCITGNSLSVSDPTFNRTLSNSQGTGIGTGAIGNCSLSGTGTAVRYDVYNFNLTGCAAFPTEITVTLCGPAGCPHVGNVDTILYLYRNVAAGDPLTANGGLANPFNPAAACTNARAAQDDLGTTSGTTNNPGGATCNQVVGANCVAPCTSPSNAASVSGFRRQLGDGSFTIVVAGFGNGTIGNYSIYVNAPAAGCNVAFAPSAATAYLGGRILSADGKGIANAVVTVTGGNLTVPTTVRSNGFGYYRFSDLQVGQTYVITVQSKGYAFTNPTQIVNLEDNVTDVNFIGEQ